jgi:glyoxylase-like metal-dependent hydrolase (beta-lactamase superfamily II)
MAEVRILVKGYTSEEADGKTQCTITLIKDKGLNIVVDPGTIKDRQILIDALKKENLSIDDINYVFISHSHMDHYRNIGMFPNAKALDFYGIWEKDEVSDWNEKFSEDINIIKTPGHDRTCISFLVRTDKGTVAIVGDVFWKKDLPEKDPYASNIEKLKKSRQLVLEKADFIVPGHGDIYEAAQK